MWQAPIAGLRRRLGRHRHPRHGHVHLRHLRVRRAPEHHRAGGTLGAAKARHRHRHLDLDESNRPQCGR
jgi:hypothetical protein